MPFLHYRDDQKSVCGQRCVGKRHEDEVGVVRLRENLVPLLCRRLLVQGDL